MRPLRATPVLAAVVALLVLAPAAFAAPVNYSLSVGTVRTGSLTLDGNQVVGLSLGAFVAGCDAGGPTTYVMQVGLPAGVTELSGNALHIETDATDESYAAGVHVVMDGTATADRGVISGTITYSGLHSVLDSGCPPTSTNFIAVPHPLTVPPDPEHAWTLTGGHLKVDATGGHITRMALVVPFACGNSVNEVSFDTRGYGLTDIATSPTGAFALVLHVLDEYDIIRVLTITGQLGASSVSARFQVANTVEVTDTWLGDCVGDATFTASVPAPPAAAPAGPNLTPPKATLPPYVPIFHPPVPVAPPTGGHQTLPHKSGPSASFDWGELRLDHGASQRYYFVVDQLTCSGRATHVRITVAGRSHNVRCGQPRAFASAPVAPATNYRLTAQAVQIRRSRIIKRGPAVVTRVRMRGPQDKWVPVSSFPGKPPTA